MTIIIDNGWLWLTNGVDELRLACKRITWGKVLDPKIEHYYSNTHWGHDLGKKWVEVKAETIKCKTHDDYASILSYLDTWQEAGTITLSVVRDSSNNKEKLDGTNTNFPVLIKRPGFKEMEKVSPGDQQKHDIGQVIFEQKGAAT